MKSSIEKPLKILAAAIFIFSGITISILALTGQIQMESSMAYGVTLRMFIYEVSSRLRNPFLDLGIIIAIILIFIIMLKRVKTSKRGKL